MPHKLWKISARYSKRCGVQLRKTHGGVASTPPPHRWGLSVLTRYYQVHKYRVTVIWGHPESPDLTNQFLLIICDSKEIEAWEYFRRCICLVKTHRSICKMTYLLRLGTTWPWPEAKFCRWPFKVIWKNGWRELDRLDSLTRQTRWCPRICCILIFKYLRCYPRKTIFMKIRTFLVWPGLEG